MTTYFDERLSSILHTLFERASGTSKEMKEIYHWLLWNDPLPPLGSTGIKNRLCRALNLIPHTTYLGINKLLKIRNDYFAHFANAISFDDPIVLKKLIEAGTVAKYDVPHPGMEGNRKRPNN